MQSRKILLAGAALLALGACASPSVVSRAAGPNLTLLSEGAGEMVAAPSYKVVDVRVDVPESLTVSEANSLIPRADIVWRGDPFGDRRAQIATLMREAMMEGAASLDGAQDAREVVLLVEVARFHALTERARYTVGGNHNIDFWLSVVDAQTGEVVEPRRFLDTDLPGLGGMAAIAAEARGESQKVRIQAFLADVIREELGKPHMIPAPAPAA